MRLSQVRTSIHKVKWGTDVEGTYGAFCFVFFLGTGLRHTGRRPAHHPSAMDRRHSQHLWTNMLDSLSIARLVYRPGKLAR